MGPARPPARPHPPRAGLTASRADAFVVDPDSQRPVGVLSTWDVVGAFAWGS